MNKDDVVRTVFDDLDYMSKDTQSRVVFYGELKAIKDKFDEMEATIVASTATLETLRTILKTVPGDFSDFFDDYEDYLAFMWPEILTDQWQQALWGDE